MTTGIILITLLLSCFLLLLLWFYGNIMILQQESWVTLCMIFRLKPIITFTLTIWSFMFSVGYKSSKAHIILLSNCWLYNIKYFMVIKSIWTFLLNKTPFVSFFCFHLFSSVCSKKLCWALPNPFFILK